MSTADEFLAGYLARATADAIRVAEQRVHQYRTDELKAIGCFIRK